MKCPGCGECDFLKGVCERLANRGRRFFLMGVLVVPLAHKIARVTEKLVVPAPKQTVTIIVDDKRLVYEASQLTRRHDWILSEWAVAT